jgi:hypothetical protein
LAKLKTVLRKKAALIDGIRQRIGRSHQPDASLAEEIIGEKKVVVFNHSAKKEEHEVPWETGMGELNVDRIVIAKTLNHPEPGVIAIYDRFGRMEDRRRALDPRAQRDSTHHRPADRQRRHSE